MIVGTSFAAWIDRTTAHRTVPTGRWIIAPQPLTPAPNAASAAAPHGAPASAERLAAGRRFAAEAARLMAHTRCHQVVVLDVSGISPVTDFMVLATGTSPRQMKTVADQAEELGEARDFRALSRSGDAGSNWLVIDFVDVVAHVFSEDARGYYDLDNLWGDARRVEWDTGEPPPELPSGAAAPAVPGEGPTQ
jgi:ribosome-associated protein